MLGIGIWVIVDPTGFQEIVAANPLLITGAYILPGHGGPAFSARLPGLLRGRPGEQVSAAVREYPMGALGEGVDRALYPH